MKNIIFTKILIGWSVAFSVYSCGQTVSEGENAIVGTKNIQYNNLAVDTIVLDTINSSFIGYSGVLGDEIYFIDKMFCTYFAFNPDGTKRYQKLRQGNGPKEVPTGNIGAGNMYADSTILMLDGNCQIHIFKNFVKQPLVQLEYHGPRESYEDYSVYSYDEDLKMNIGQYGNSIYVNAQAAAEGFGSRDATIEHFDKSHILMQHDITTGKVVKMRGNYSDLYRQNPHKYKYLSSIYYDIDHDGDFFITYEVDSLVQVYDNDFKPLHRFGFEGRDMKNDYPVLGPSKEEYLEFYDSKDKYGLYNSVKYIEPVDMVVRTYKKGGDATTDGLQIYKDNDLVADIDVPLGFKIGGYIAPYFYSQVVGDEEAETLTVYRFKLD